MKFNPVPHFYKDKDGSAKFTPYKHWHFDDPEEEKFVIKGLTVFLIVILLVVFIFG